MFTSAKSSNQIETLQRSQSGICAGGDAQTMSEEITQTAMIQQVLALPAVAELLGNACCETGGVVFTDGSYVELMKDVHGRLMLLDSRTEEQQENASAIYVLPNIHKSVQRLLILPTQRVSCGSITDLFKKICQLFHELGISHDNAKLLTYFVVATWFTDVLPVAPYLFIAGPRPEAHVVLQLLGSLVRHGLSVADVSPMALKRVPMPAQPTLVIGNLQQPMYRSLIMSIYPDAYVPLGNGFVDLYCAKAAYAGTTVADGMMDEPILRVHLAPSRKKLPLISAAMRRTIEEDFQPRLLDYRLRYAAQVRDIEWDVPILATSLRLVAQLLGSCIIDAPDLRAGIADLLKGQQELLAADQWIDPQRVVLEAILERCHAEQPGSRLGIGEVATAVAETLRDRGEARKIEPKLVGNFVRALGFSPKRDTQGFALILNEEVRRKAHRLIRAYQVDVVPNADNNCSYCTEISGVDSGRTAT